MMCLPVFDARLCGLPFWFDGLTMNGNKDAKRSN
jgi:hypothetical protein